MSQCEGWEKGRQGQSRGWQDSRSKDQGHSLRTRSLGGHLGMVTSPARLLPAEGAQGLRIDRLSGEVKNTEGNSSSRESSTRPRTSDRTQTAGSESTHLGKGRRTLAGRWLNTVGRKRFQILRACVYVCGEKL